jgi:hypothetical protein
MADMNEQTTGLLGIGAFSSLVRLSVRMLRYYDKQAESAHPGVPQTVRTGT